MQKIIFLDFDGVMLTDGFAREQAQNGLTFSNYVDVVQFDPDCVANLLHLINQTGAEIVLSTSWAEHAPFSKLAQVLLRNGIDPGFVFEYDDPSERAYMTPRTHLSTRGAQIQAWLHNHPHIESFVALDDLGSVKMFKNRGVQTDPTRGFDRAALGKALAAITG